MASLYAKGYADGFKAGKEKGENEIVKNDLQAIYGMMCIRLHDIGFSEQQIEDLCYDIQDMWIDEYNEMVEKAEHGESNIPVVQKVKDITGIDLKGIFG